MKNERTPRCLADSEFRIGYERAVFDETRWIDVFFAVALGIIVSVLIVVAMS